jgi:hypothetical protein
LAQRIISQFAAVSVAVILSGAPQLIEPPERVGHRCQCPVRGGKHECDCPLCHAEAARLGKAAAVDPSLPACHRALAAKARTEADQSAKRRAAAAPCLTSTCGTGDGRIRPPPATERFTVPPAWQVSEREVIAEVAVARQLVLSPLREPETPPPRRA